MEIRPVLKGDLADLAKLHAQSWQQTYKGMLSEDYLATKVVEDRLLLWQKRLMTPEAGQKVVVAIADGELIGFICLMESYTQEFCLLDNLHVSANAQGKGVAKQLIYHGLNSLKLELDKGLSLEVLLNNHKAIRFYESLGGIKEKQQMWLAPCGSKVEELIYQWPSIKALLTHLNSKSA